MQAQFSKHLENLLNIPRSQDKIAWEPYEVKGREGVEIFRLYDMTNSEKNGPAAALLRYQPGAKVTRHLHNGYELVLVLEGILINDTGEHQPGTLEVYPPGSTHQLESKTGCVFLVVWEQPVEVIQ